jgi:hypothetical protein
MKKVVPLLAAVSLEKLPKMCSVGRPSKQTFYVVIVIVIVIFIVIVIVVV